jgi:hypothetical protein
VLLDSLRRSPSWFAVCSLVNLSDRAEVLKVARVHTARLCLCKRSRDLKYSSRTFNFSEAASPPSAAISSARELQGQRIDPADIYRHALDKTVARAESAPHGEPGCLAGEGRKYHHIVYRAH